MTRSAAAADGNWDEARHALVERLALAMSQMGLQRMSARTLAMLMVADEDSLSIREFVDRLGCSNAALSVAARQLEQLGLVTRTRLPGERSDRWALPELGFTAFVPRDQAMRAWLDVTAEAIGVVGEQSKAGARLSELHDFLDFMIKVFPEMLEQWLADREQRTANSE